MIERERREHREHREHERRQPYLIQVIWRGKSEGEAAVGRSQVIFSDDQGTVLTYSRAAFEAIIDGYAKLRARELS